MAEIEGLVLALREGDDAAKAEAAGMLGHIAWGNDANKAAIVKAGGIAPLVELLRDGSANSKYWAARALVSLAFNNNANKFLIAEAGGIPLLLELARNARDGDWVAKGQAALALGSLARNNDANAVAIAATMGLDALVQLARRGRVTVDNRTVVRNAGVAAKRKAALVVAALLRDYVPDSVPRDIKAVIGSYL